MRPQIGATGITATEQAEPARASWPARWRGFLYRPVDGASLAVFRICFGALMFVDALRYWSFGWVYRYFIEPQFFFGFLPFIKPWPGQGMYWHYAGLAVLALMIATGFHYRVAALLFALGFTYVFLLDKALYLNHFYLICLISFLLALVPANQCFSLDRRRGKVQRHDFIPNWSLWVFRAQVVLVYFYGGIAKLNEDWLRGEPQRTWLSWRSDLPVLGPWLTQEPAVWVVTYGGILTDLIIGFILLWPPTFWLGVALAVIFNVSNAIVFSIGIFPFFMLGTLVLFPRADWPRRLGRAWKEKSEGLLGRLTAPRKRLAVTKQAFWKRPRAARVLRPQSVAQVVPQFGWRKSEGWLLMALHVYFALQLLLPFRHHLYPGNVSWTEEGHRFAWHMKLRDKEANIDMFLTDPRTGKRQWVDIKSMLSSRQFHKMATRPDMIQQLAHHLAAEYERTNRVRPQVHAYVMASLNRRPFQLLIDPQVDLAAQPFTLLSKPWIVPLQDRERGAAGALHALPHTRPGSFIDVD